MNNKRYLTGVDWLIYTFDHMNKKMIGSGNEFHIILEAEGVLDSALLEEDLNKFISGYPVLNGRVARGWNLAPYWKIEKKKTHPHIVVQKNKIKNIIGFNSSLDELLNKHHVLNNSFVFCDLIVCNNQSYVIFSFSHKLFDGLGAELFIETFQKYLSKDDHFKIQDQLAEPSHLNNWREKFASGKVVNRKLIQLSPGGRLRTFALKDKDTDFSFETIHFNEVESLRIIERANKEAGYLLIMPFLLVKVVGLFNELFNKKGIAKDNIVVPITVNARLADERTSKVFFNHLSFQFYKFTPQEAQDSKKTLLAVKEQLFVQMKTKFSKQFNENAMLMRILPVSILSKLFGLYSKGKMASFSFSYVGETSFQSGRIYENKVSNLFHLPRPSVPPGIGVFFNNYNGKLNVTLTYLKSMLTKSDIDFLISEFRKLSDE